MKQNKKTKKEIHQHLLEVLSSPRFISMQGIGNEVPFFICPYDPEKAIEMEKIQKQLFNELYNNGKSVLEINLYDIAIKLLKERGIWDQILSMEANISKDQLNELLQGVLDPETHLVPAIAEIIKSSDYKMIFLSGVGEVFPYIRSHNVLNNLQSIVKDKPMILFFPGGYTHSVESGASLDLFGRLHDDKYYRAFNIFDYEV